MKRVSVYLTMTIGVLLVVICGCPVFIIEIHLARSIDIELVTKWCPLQSESSMQVADDTNQLVSGYFRQAIGGSDYILIPLDMPRPS